MDLKSKFAVVTGGNSGIGLAVATALARAESNIVIAARHQKRNLAVADGIRAIALCPAMVAAPMTGVSGSDYVQPGDIAETVLYLLRLFPAAWPTEIVLERKGADRSRCSRVPARIVVSSLTSPARIATVLPCKRGHKNCLE